MNHNEIYSWEESIIELSDARFFNLMELYLGKIATPFNKQKLVEQLRAYLQKNSVKQNITVGLDYDDILFLTAIDKINTPTLSMLTALFDRQMTYTKLYNKLLNIEERLLIYKIKNEIGEYIYKINPLIKDCIIEFSSENVFFLPEKTEYTDAKELKMTNALLFGICSFFMHNKNILKSDGTLKKKPYEKLQTVIPYFFENPCYIYTLFSALENLGLIIKTETGFLIQKQKWVGFSNLTFFEKQMYIIAASLFHCRSDDIQFLVSLFIDFIKEFKHNCLYNMHDVERFFSLLCMQKICEKNFNQDSTMYALLKVDKTTLFSFIISINVLCKKDDYVYINSDLFKTIDVNEKPFLVEPSFEVTVLPNSNLTVLLQSLDFLNPVIIQTASKFELTKQTCLNAFSNNQSDITILNVLSSMSAHNIPQNICVSISDWYKNFTAISLFKGFIVSVSLEKQIIFESHADIKKIIHRKLGDGIYLLNIDDTSQFEMLAKRNSFDFIFFNGKQEQPVCKNIFVKRNIEKYCGMELPHGNIIKKSDLEIKIKANENEYEKKINLLNRTLNQKNIGSDEKNILKEKIANRVITTEKQITDANVKYMVQEAFGIDFVGKLKLIENAIECNSVVQMFLNTKTGVKKILCNPIKLIKTETNTIVIVITKKLKKELSIPIGKIAKLKFIRDIFRNQKP